MEIINNKFSNPEVLIIHDVYGEDASEQLRRKAVATFKINEIEMWTDFYIYFIQRNNIVRREKYILA